VPDSQLDRVSFDPLGEEPQLRSGGVCLVVGDWFVDEHWVCGVHRSASSSRTGQTHLRALHSPMSTVRAFCGAGRSALFLYHLYRRPNVGEPLTSLIGLGFWHRADTNALTSLFDLGSPAQTPYRLTPAELVPPSGIGLINMNDALNFGDGRRTDDEHVRFRDNREYTTRIIRIYTHGERDEVKYDRLDWERRAPKEVPWPRPKLEKLSAMFTEQLEGRVVEAVIIKDLQKGVINKAIIDWLVSLNLGQVPWFVSSKAWCPSWLQKLGDRVDLRLVMVPQVAAQAAIHDEGRKLSRWITRSGRPSKEAFDLIDDFATFTQAKNIFVLPEGFSALACECQADGDAGNGKGSNAVGVRSCVIQSLAEPEKITVDMGYASIVFPALVACMSAENKECVDEEIMNRALRAAYEWVDSEAQRVLYPQYWTPNPDSWAGENRALDYIKDLLHQHVPTYVPRSFGRIRTCIWSDEQEEWTQALTEVGIVGRKDNKGGSLELWRSMLEIDGYVCCEESTRKELKQLVQGVHAFAKHPRYHSSCMLVASPGSGKTFLAKRLAETADLRFVPFNITQMRSKGDILECLDTIVAIQAENSTRPLMVFIDEINSKLENAWVYGAFLTPLEDGTYVRNGRTFNIRPCVWVFAGTHHPKGEDRLSLTTRAAREAESPEKGSDFVSRLTLGVMNLINTGGSRGRDDEDIQDQKIRATERVYLGASMLRHEFPDVRLVSELVLRAFWELPRSTTVREIKHFVRRFSDIQYGEVTSRSVPDRWPGDLDDRDMNRWRAWKDQRKYSDKPDVFIVTAVELERDAPVPLTQPSEDMDKVMHATPGTQQ
jgi:ATPase family protein associated with various cellular activities (AAA)